MPPGAFEWARNIISPASRLKGLLWVGPSAAPKCLKNGGIQGKINLSSQLGDFDRSAKFDLVDDLDQAGIGNVDPALA